MYRTRLAVVLLLIAACGVSAAGAAQITVVATGGPTENQTIAEIAQASPNLSTLVTALQAADLVETLNGEGPFTVFAPTNAAFDALFAQLPPGSFDALLANRTALTAILTYHVVPGEYSAAQVGSQSSLPTVQGSPLAVTALPGGVVRVDEATVILPDIQASNGVIHVIDAVVVPPVGNATTPTPTVTGTVTLVPTVTGNVTGTATQPTTAPPATPTGITTGVPFVPPAGAGSSSEDYTGAGGEAPTSTPAATAEVTAGATATVEGNATATVSATPTMNMTPTTGAPAGNATQTPAGATPVGTATALATAPVNTTATRAGIDALPLGVLSLAALALLAARRR
jgi:uncharacterized surface protein with fasciclin (FAS1) repeats